MHAGLKAATSSRRSVGFLMGNSVFFLTRALRESVPVFGFWLGRGSAPECPSLICPGATRCPDCLCQPQFKLKDVVELVRDAQADTSSIREEQCVRQN
jgi:hypothetical protein